MEKRKRPLLKLIGISGKIGSGKDTTAELIQLVTTYGLNHLTEVRKVTPRLMDIPDFKTYTLQNANWQIEKYAENLKLIASMLTGIPRKNFEDQEFKKTHLGPEWNNITVREFLQTLGTRALRDNLNENVWVNSLFGNFNESSQWLVTDTRFPNEANAIKERGGIVVRVDRGLSTGDHPSETALDDYEFDYIISNTGTIEELIEEVVKFVTLYEL